MTPGLGAGLVQGSITAAAVATFGGPTWAIVLGFAVSFDVWTRP